MNATINLANGQIIPKEGLFNPNGERFTVNMLCTDMSGASIAFSVQSTLDPTNDAMWANVADSSDESISLTLTSGVALVRTIDCDPDASYRLKTTTTGGNVAYIINP